MYSRGSSLGKNIWDDGRIHIPPGYKGNAFHSFASQDFLTNTVGKIHPPEQKLYTRTNHSQQRDFPNEELSDTPFGNTEEETISYKAAPDTEETNESEEPPDIPPEKTGEAHPQNTQLSDLLSGFLHSLDREEWLLIFVLILLLADGSDAWDVILLLLVLLGVH